MNGYHMRRHDLAIADRNEIDGLLEEGKYATLALSLNDAPYAVTMNYGYDPEGNALFFHSAASGRKIESLRGNPRACATVIRDEGYQEGRCTHHYSSVVIEGSVSILETREEKMAGFRVLFRHLEKDFRSKEKRLEGMPGDLEKVVVFKLSMDRVSAKRGHG